MAKTAKEVVDLNAYRRALEIFNDGLPVAVEAIVEICENPEYNPATRLQACQTLLSNITKITETIQEEEARREESARRELARKQEEKDNLKYAGMTAFERTNAQLADMLNRIV